MKISKVYLLIRWSWGEESIEGFTYSIEYATEWCSKESVRRSYTEVELIKEILE